MTKAQLATVFEKLKALETSFGNLEETMGSLVKIAPAIPETPLPGPGPPLPDGAESVTTELSKETEPNSGQLTVAVQTLQYQQQTVTSQISNLAGEMHRLGKLEEDVTQVREWLADLTDIEATLNKLIAKVDEIEQPSIDEIVKQVIAKMPARQIDFLDGDGNVASSITVPFGEPIPIPAQRLQTMDKDDNFLKETTAPLGEPLGMRFKPVTKAK